MMSILSIFKNKYFYFIFEHKTIGLSILVNKLHELLLPGYHFWDPFLSLNNYNLIF